MKLAELIGSSSWAADYLTRHPILLDELLDSRLFAVSTDWQEFRANLQARLAQDAGDTERAMDIPVSYAHRDVYKRQAVPPAMARSCGLKCACDRTAIRERWSAGSGRSRTTSARRAAEERATPGSRPG